MLDAGTAALAWNLVNTLTLGPNSWKGMRCESDWKVEVPEASCVVMTRRGGRS